MPKITTEITDRSSQFLAKVYNNETWQAASRTEFPKLSKKLQI